jgi:hypothetical protein
VKGEKREDPVPEEHRNRRSKALPRKGYILGIFGICKLCGWQEYRVYAMSPSEKFGEPWLKSELQDDTTQVDKIEYRRRRTCCYCRGELNKVKKADIIEKLITMADPSIANYKVMKEKLNESS